MNGANAQETPIKTGYPDGKIVDNPMGNDNNKEGGDGLNNSDAASLEGPEKAQDGEEKNRGGQEPEDNEPDGKGKGADPENKIVSPAGDAENDQADKPLNPDQQFDKPVDDLFKGKKQTPSPDEIMSALQYELSNMVKKDKHIAKQQVLKNLKNDPHYYTNLDMLNIDDKKMKVDENSSTFSKTKALLDKMVAERQQNRPVATSPELNQIFKDLTDKRMAIRNKTFRD